MERPTAPSPLPEQLELFDASAYLGFGLSSTPPGGVVDGPGQPLSPQQIDALSRSIHRKALSVWKEVDWMRREHRRLLNLGPDPGPAPDSSGPS